MKRTVPLHEFMPYGAPDLLVAARPQLSRALTLASFLVAAFTFAWGWMLASMPPVVEPPAIPRIAEFIHERIVIDRIATPRSIRPVAPAPPRPGRYEPVEQAPPLAPESTLDYGRLAEQVQPGTGGASTVGPMGGTATTVDPDAPVDYVEELPVAATRVLPEYPEFGRQALVEGKVVVLVLVGRDGRVREAKVDEHQHVPLLDAAALDAARRWVFSPALVNGNPVAVWTAIPFRFTLGE